MNESKPMPLCCHTGYGLRTAQMVNCKLPVRYFSEFWTGTRTVRNHYCTRHAKRRGVMIEGLEPIAPKAVAP